MAVLRANSVHDWASYFLQVLANDAEGGEFDRVLDETRIPGFVGVDRLRVVGAATPRLRLDSVAAVVP
jgi:hypothetical protein